MIESVRDHQQAPATRHPMISFGPYKRTTMHYAFAPWWRLPPVAVCLSDIMSRDALCTPCLTVWMPQGLTLLFFAEILWSDPFLGAFCLRLDDRTIVKCFCGSSSVDLFAFLFLETTSARMCPTSMLLPSGHRHIREKPHPGAAATFRRNSWVKWHDAKRVCFFFFHLIPSKCPLVLFHVP